MMCAFADSSGCWNSTPREYGLILKAWNHREIQERDRDRVLAYNIAALATKAFNGGLKAFDQEFQERKTIDPKTIAEQQSEFKQRSAELRARPAKSKKGK